MPRRHDASSSEHRKAGRGHQPQAADGQHQDRYPGAAQPQPDQAADTSHASSVATVCGFFHAPMPQGREKE